MADLRKDCERLPVGFLSSSQIPLLKQGRPHIAQGTGFHFVVTGAGEDFLGISAGGLGFLVAAPVAKDLTLLELRCRNQERCSECAG